MQRSSEQSLLVTDVHAQVMDTHSPELTEHISVAADTAFGDQAQNAISTIINGLAGEEVAECAPIGSIKIVQRLHEVAMDKDDVSSATGAAALLSTIALGYQPTHDPETTWQRRGSALSAVAREIIGQPQPEHQFVELFSAVGQACIKGTTRQTKDTAAFNLVDVHDTLAPQETEPALEEAQPEPPEEQPTRAAFVTIQTSPEPVAPTAEEAPRHQLAFAEVPFQKLDSRAAVTRALSSFPWLRNRIPAKFAPETRVLEEDGKAVAKVVNLIPIHPAVARVRASSRIDQEKLDELLAPAINHATKKTSSASLKTKDFGGVPLTYLRKNGASERVIRVYFRKIAEEADKTPVFAIVGACRTKAWQARLLTVFTGKRIQSRKLKA